VRLSEKELSMIGDVFFPAVMRSNNQYRYLKKCCSHHVADSTCKSGEKANSDIDFASFLGHGFFPQDAVLRICMVCAKKSLWQPKNNKAPRVGFT
jgi:hypothetical protein